jgi:hypothetical protein
MPWGISGYTSKWPTRGQYVDDERGGVDAGVHQQHDAEGTIGSNPILRMQVAHVTFNVRLSNTLSVLKQLELRRRRPDMVT